MNHLLKEFCLREDLKTYDPYDIWKTGLGIRVKNLFNTSRALGALPALGLSLYDLLFNNSVRLGYNKQEYPIVRALSCQILLNEYGKTGDNDLLSAAIIHLKWLDENKSVGYSGACWGLGFTWSAFRDIIYDANTPHVTHTPYALEAFHLYTRLTGDKQYVDLIRSSFLFFENDIHVLYEDEEMMAVSYGPYIDKIVNNASSYTLFAYSILLQYYPEKREYILKKISKLFRFVQKNQHPDGSWFYSHPEEESFIDCFHSCFIIKNLYKASKVVSLSGLDRVVENGFRYINENFYNSKYGLYKRFTRKNKLSLTRFDLYDNAEVLNLVNILGDEQRAGELAAAIRKHFIEGDNVYSAIDLMGVKRNRNTLRWAVMPYLYAISGLN